jgi:hypothetical protein
VSQFTGTENIWSKVRLFPNQMEPTDTHTGAIIAQYRLDNGTAQQQCFRNQLPAARQDLTFWRAKMAWSCANWLFWWGCERLVGQADLLTHIKAHAILSAWPAAINFDKKMN